MKSRRQVDTHLPEWKYRVNAFNVRYVKLERFVQKILPYLLFVLLIVLFGEYGYLVWSSLTPVSLWFESYRSVWKVLDMMIICAIGIDLYFGFFRKRTLGRFFSGYYLDIISILPFAYLLRTARLGDAQAALSVATEIERDAIRLVRELERSSRFVEFERFIARSIRLLRLHRIREWWHH